MMKRCFSVLAAVVCFIGSCPSAHGAQAVFEREIVEDGARMRLLGVGTKHFLVVKVFDAGFYLGEGVPTGDVLGDVPRRLEVAYVQSIPAVKLARETRRRMQLNATPAEFARIQERVDEMDNYFADIKPGDRYILSYVPGRGTDFIYNGKVLGRILGADFSRVLFAVWVGEKPIDPSLKAHLLSSGGKSEPYYDDLLRACAREESVNCCESSVRAMEQGGFRLAVEGGCPAMMRRNMQKCISSYQWCEPQGSVP